MTYLDLINRFHKNIDLLDISPTDGYLYFVLLNEANKSFWQPKFEVSDAEICKKMKIGSHNTLIKSRENLVRAGLIEFTRGGGSAKTQYSLTASKNETLPLQKMKDRVSKNETLPLQKMKDRVSKNETRTETTPYIYSKDFKDINKDSLKTENFEKSEPKKNEKKENEENSFVDTQLDNQTKGRGAASFENQTNLEIPENLNTPEFAAAWGDLLKTKRFAKRTEIALKTILIELAVYPSNFAISLVKTAIMGEYGNVIYPDTPQKFEAWKKSQINAHDTLTQNFVPAVPAETKKTVARVVKPSW